MNILFLTHYFPPEVGAPQTRIFELAQKLRQRGHQISILAPFPHYPTGRVPETYQGKLYTRENMAGLNVIRTWVYATPNKGTLKRIINHLSFMTTAAILGSFLLEKHAIIIVESPPLFTGNAGVWLKWLWQSPYIFNVADLWPESAIALGALTNQVIIKLAEWQERFLYWQASRITVMTPRTKEILVQRGYPAEKIVWLPNGVDTDLFDASLSRSEARRRLGWKNNKTVALYAGTHGMAQGLTIILHAADHLRHRSDIEFLLVGDGADKESLLKLKDDLKLRNVRFLDSLPKFQMPTLLAASDIALVVLKDLPLFRMVIPSKIYEAMAMERPIVLGVAGETAQIIQRAQSGVCIPPENATALAEAVEQLVDQPDKRLTLGKNGRTYVQENFERNLLVNRLETILIELLAENA